MNPSDQTMPAPGAPAHQPPGDMIPIAAGGQAAPQAVPQAMPESAANTPPPMLPSAPAAQAPVPAMPPAPQAPAPATSSTPAVADDLDLIEKEWVEKAKSIVAETRNDPYAQNKEMNKIKADYMQKRYNKEIKVDQ